MAQGTATIDFGAFPGKTDATATVTGIAGAPTLGEAWIIPVATADHSADEHIVDPPALVAAAPSGGVMVVTGVFRGATEGRFNNSNPGRCYGLWSFAWVTN